MWVSAIFPLHFPVPLSVVGSFTKTNNMSINVYGVDEYIATPEPMLLTATVLRSFNNAATCHICTKLLGDDKV